MAKRLQYRRLLMLAIILAAAFAGLGYRLVDLQVVRHDELSEKAQQNTQQEFQLEPRRGDILDVKGNLLATSVFVKTVCADPSLIGNHQAEIAHVLSPLLQQSEAQLVQQLTPRTRVNDKGQTLTNMYVILKKKVAVETWQKVQAAMTNIAFGVDEKKISKADQAFYRNLRQKAIFTDLVDDQLRAYPNQSLASHVLGYVGSDQREEDGKSFPITAGKEGVEQTFDSKLRGVKGWRVTERDGRHREMVTLRDQNVPAQNGLNVVLTVDSMLQHILETALADGMEKHSPISISGILVRPRTGEILAMATLPDFDPNYPGNATPDARRNRAITDVAEPGSTFKIVVVSAALTEKIVRPTDVFDCEHGHFLFAGRNLHDHISYDSLSVQDIITKSSNIGAAKIGIKLGEKRLAEYMHDFGFGVRSGIPLSGEAAGIVHRLKEWSKVSIAQIPMGQGVAVTRLQMAMAMCAIANGGSLMQPMLVDRLEDSDHKVVVKYTPQRVRQVISESASKEMVTALKTVVSTNGTAPKAALEHYTVAGKTGTAQKAGPGGYLPGRYFSSFVGFFPADDPELCISVTMDEPKGEHYGGQTAAPIFKQIAERAANYLNIRPEDGEAPSLTDPVAAPNDNQVPKRAAARTR
jgi:cell division protein FtsI/penicillin-binding protein 2